MAFGSIAGPAKKEGTGTVQKRTTGGFGGNAYKKRRAELAPRIGGRDTGGRWHGFGSSGGGPVQGPGAGGGGSNLPAWMTGGGSGGGGGGGGVPSMPPGGPSGPTFKTQAPGEMKEVMQMYRDLIAQNRDLAGEFDIEDLMGKQRAEHSIQSREAEAMGARTGGQSAAEKRNQMMDQSRGMAETRGTAERGKLDFERGLLQDMGAAIGGAGGMSGEMGRFMNQARGNEIDVWNTMTNYPLRLAQIQAQANASNASALAQLSGLV